MGPFWSLVIVIGPILLLAALLYAWLRNRNASQRNRARAERGAREVREEIAGEEERRGLD